MLIRSGFFAASLGMLFVHVAECEEVSFAKDILPLLSDRCFQCHGPDEKHREAGLRLDLPEVVSQNRDQPGVLVPGSLEKSDLWDRITSNDPDLVMPPPDAQRVPLTVEEVDKVRRWILGGALWEEHWAFRSLAPPDLGKFDGNPIDYFIEKGLGTAGLEPLGLAEEVTRLRRLSFALRGVGPNPAELERFTKLPQQTRWAQTIEGYLNSSLHAERMAMWWLDVARYSDSDGYQQDQTRENWPWRDWVIQAFQQNMPFDQFTREQFAGDLIENATPDQILATCFHRNHMTNGEGGRDSEESRVDYVLDRTNTMGTVWLGLTLGCTQCHSHKFDPISQHDYYSLTAFFNSIDEDGRAGKNAKPYLSFESPFVANRISAMQEVVSSFENLERAELISAKEKFGVWFGVQRDREAPSYNPWLNPRVHRVTSSEGTEFAVREDGIIQTTGPMPNQDDYRIEFDLPEGLGRITGWRIEVLPDSKHINGMFTRSGNGDFILTNVKTLIRQADNPNEVELENASVIADYQARKDRKTKWDTRYSNIRETLNDDARDGWTTQGAPEVTPHVGVYTLSEPYSVKRGDQLVVILKQRSTLGDANIGRFRVSITSERGETLKRVDSSSPLADLYAIPLAERDSLSTSVQASLLNQFLLDQDQYQETKKQLARAKGQLGQLRGQAKPRSVMVLKEREEARKTHVLVRGVWDAHGDEVAPGFLSSILPGKADRPKNRLDLANWLVSSATPLTSRVIVNHLWQLIFGRGLVATTEDFGLQGEQPSHPELLDWLAAELVKNDWNLRHVIRLMVSSQAFQRSSVVVDELREADPKNRWLARGPRYRLDAWMLRDNALRIAELLDESIGGPPVYPYQPVSLWSEITMGRFQYDPSLGDEQYRRTIYAFWRRSSAPAFLFDSAQRRVCEVRRSQTNTPLQALTLLNDETYLECSRVLAESISGVQKDESAAQEIAVRVLSRKWTATEMKSVLRVFRQSLDYYQTNPAEAAKYVRVGQQSVPEAAMVAKVAAWMTCVSMALNLDEAITLE